MVDAIYNDHLIASSPRTIVVEGNHYFPPEHVNQEFLQPSSMRTLCPWKGIASYYHVTVAGVRDANAAWTYRHPSPFARKIKNYVAFGGQIQIPDGDA
jgi:uncharacterized protein (DUF427 family)